jgi:hypothetical protein
MVAVAGSWILSKLVFSVWWRFFCSWLVVVLFLVVGCWCGGLVASVRLPWTCDYSPLCATAPLGFGPVPSKEGVSHTIHYKLSYHIRLKQGSVECSR